MIDPGVIMSEIDQYQISRIIGSTFRPVSRPSFSAFGVARTTGEMLATREKSPTTLTRDNARDAKIVRAFAAVHQGYATDRLLADPHLSQLFLKEVRSLGLQEPTAAINRRLLRIRKATDLPVRLPKTTKTEKRDLHPYLIPAEIAYALLGYQYDVSFDDLLADPELLKQFDDLAIKIDPRGTIVDYRLAALHLRKNIRSRSDAERNEVARTSESEVSQRWRTLGKLASLKRIDVPDSEGIFSLSEPNRYLFLTRFADLRSGIAQVQDGKLLSALGNRFWQPNVSGIDVRIITPTVQKKPNLKVLEMKALDLYRPLYNLLPRAA